jgi:uncharacterized protein
MLSPDLLRAIIDQHALKGGHSIHFVDHWARVYQNGQKLTPLTGARWDVVELFAVFHDSGRWSDGTDNRHGARGAKIAKRMHGKYFQLDPAGLDLLLRACVNHTRGLIQEDVTVQTCWDCDRLDLARAGFFPDPKRLCTLPARDPDTIEWANQRALSRYFPQEVLAEWGLNASA